MKNGAIYGFEIEILLKFNKSLNVAAEIGLQYFLINFFLKLIKNYEESNDASLDLIRD